MRRSKPTAPGVQPSSAPPPPPDRGIVGRPEIVAHRGASDDSPEHTLLAYSTALDAGADALECDIRLTADGHLVCVHDRTVKRTSNGRGTVSTLELAELSQLDWGSWKNPWADLDDESEQPDRDQLGILTLERLFEMVKDCDRRIEVAVEAKHPTRYAGYVERRLVELLHRFGWAHPPVGEVSPIRVMSFSWLSLRRIRDLAPSLRTVYLMDRVPLRLRDGSLPLGVKIAGPSMGIIRADPGYVTRVHAMGHEVHVWVVNDESDLDLCAGLGVDSIITDRPARAAGRFTLP